MANLHAVVRSQLQGANSATGDLVEAVATLLQLTDEVDDSNKDLADRLRDELKRILRDATEISRSVNTAAAVTANTASAG